MLSNEEMFTQPLKGLPATVKVDGKPIRFGPYLKAREAREAYCKSAGIKTRALRTYVKLDRLRATCIAQEYDKAKPTPDDPVTLASYNALSNETMAQYVFVKLTGLQVEFYPRKYDPYGNPRKAILDIVQNKHMYILPTADAYGPGEGDLSDSVNPMLRSSGETISGRDACVNDIFRVVHDFFGHAKEGVGFRAEGEENAWRSHSAMYSPLARKAMSTETRGQNCWVNWGPHGQQNRTANAGATQYPDQKMTLLPDWVSEEGAEDPEEEGEEE